MHFLYYLSMRKSRLSELFVAGSTARTAASLVGVNSKTAVYYFQRLREIIYLHNDTSEQFASEVEVDESYFGGSRKGKRGRGAAGKVPVFGLLKRNGKIYTVMIPDAKTKTLMPIIREKVKPDRIKLSAICVNLMEFQESIFTELKTTKLTKQ